MTSIQQIRRIIGTILLSTTAVVATAAVLVLAIDFVLLIFLGILFGVFLTKTSQLLARLLPIGYGWNLTIVTTALVLLLVGSLILFGARIEDRLDRTSEQLDTSAAKLETWIREYPMAMKILKQVPFTQETIFSEDSTAQDPSPSHKPSASEPKESTSEKNRSLHEQSNDKAESGSQESSANAEKKSGTSASLIRSTAGKVFAVLGQILATTFGFVANAGVIFFIGVFLAVNPELYRDGFAKLFPTDKRPRIVEVMNRASDAMFNWLKGRFLSMLITGAGTAVALLLLGVPMPITIGIITGLLTFIPNVGGIIALCLAMLLALSQGPMTVVWVVVLYSILQLIESNVITPLILQRETSIPPALLLGFQIVMGALTGFIGLLVATPMLAAGMVLVKELWIKDTLGDKDVDS
jgi:predicted PurR-regulated permease PerM